MNKSNSAAILDNTVSAKSQIDENKYNRFIGNPFAPLKIMIIGNSITRHGPKSEIGWNHDCGMAASEKDKDYVHLLMKNVNTSGLDAQYLICQMAEWERSFWLGEEILNKFFKPAAEFNADIIITRLAENVKQQCCEEHDFHQHFEKLLAFLNPSGKARMVLTTSFWYSPFPDEGIRKSAKKHGYPLVELGHLGEQNCMKAIGLFEHAGVAAHPGDEGMKAIAEAIWEVLGPLLIH